MYKKTPDPPEGERGSSQMTKTEHYQLSQWEATDQVKRTDFNEDNAKLDAALAAKAESASVNAAINQLQAAVAAKADSSSVTSSVNTLTAQVEELAGDLRQVKLLEYTTPSSASQINLNLSGIDLSQYLELIIYFTAHTTKNVITGTAQKLWLRFNNSANITMYQEVIGGTVTHIDLGPASPSSTVQGVGVVRELHINLMAPQSLVGYCLVMGRGDSGLEPPASAQYGFTTRTDVNPSNLTALNFLLSDDTYQFAAGAKFYVLGVRK